MSKGRRVERAYDPGLFSFPRTGVVTHTGLEIGILNS